MSPPRPAWPAWPVASEGLNSVLHVAAVGPQFRRSRSAVLVIQGVDINQPHAGVKVSDMIGSQAADADRAAITALLDASYRDHSAAIRGKALQMTRDAELAADVTQEAFLRLFVEARAGRSPDNVSAWLYRTSHNIIVSRARHTAVAHRFEPRLARLDTPAEPDAIAVLHEERTELDQALATLSATDRTALVLAADGATGVEIAHHIGRTQLATRALLCRARRRLRAAADSDRRTAGQPSRHDTPGRSARHSD